MQHKLHKFTAFASTLYPHETDYLLSVQNFEIADNLRILNLIHYNSQNPKVQIPYDVTIDKRRYSYMKNWIEKTLALVDVDRFFGWLVDVEKMIMADDLLPADEDQLLAVSGRVDFTHYYFIRFYEVMQKYRDYLLIRTRLAYYEPVASYLESFREHYQRLKEINLRLNEATVDIIEQHQKINRETRKWADFLNECYYNKEGLDGYTRYSAAVRLTYLYYNYREFGKLRELYDDLDLQLKSGTLYSKRILANYYANRTMMHSRLNELDEAEKYGTLSLRFKNSDYLFYLLNLCSVLLKDGKNREALRLMNEALPELKKTASYYYKIGFVSYYIRTLLANRKYQVAAEYAESYLQAYRKEILYHRWHLFFAAYVEALFKAEDFRRLGRTVKRYGLVQKERQYRDEAKYVPVIQWYYMAAEFIEGNITRERILEALQNSAGLLKSNEYQFRRVRDILKELAPQIPDITSEIQKELEHN